MTRKNVIADYADSRFEAYKEAALAIHAKPEVSNYEFFACDTLSQLLDDEGFEVTKDVAGHRTGFTGVYKSASEKKGPVVVFLAEYDALEGLGHACGHNLFGATSVLAAASLKQVIDETGGEIRVYGTPGEEGGENGSAKGSFVREGFFKDVDFALCVHPGSDCNYGTTETLACAPVDIEFWGRPAHAAAKPEAGINALDALIQVYNSVNALRQHLTGDVRIHGIIVNGGQAPNIVPEYAKAKFYIRAAKLPTLKDVYAKVERIVEGAALATGAKGSMKPYQNLVENTIVTPKFDAIYREQILSQGEDYDDSEATSIGSSDVGNVSQVVPTIQPSIRISATPVTGHTVEKREACASELGLKSIAIGAKALAFTALELIENPEKLAEIKADHQASLEAQEKACR